MVKTGVKKKTHKKQKKRTKGGEKLLKKRHQKFRWMKIEILFGNK